MQGFNPELLMKDDIGGWECLSLPFKPGLNPDLLRNGVKTRWWRMAVLNADDRSAIQARVKYRTGEKRVKDPMMKDDNAEFWRLLSHAS
jgi:hypothetical protein